KTAKSRRVVPLDASVVAMLRRHRIEQTAERLAAQEWTDNGPGFTDELGGLVGPRTVLRVLQDAATLVGMAGVGLHPPRHSAAVSWLEQGFTSRRCRICSGRAASRSPATCTATPPTRAPAPRSPGWPDGSACETRPLASSSAPLSTTRTSGEKRLHRRQPLITS